MGEWEVGEAKPACCVASSPTPYSLTPLLSFVRRVLLHSPVTLYGAADGHPTLRAVPNHIVAFPLQWAICYGSIPMQSFTAPRIRCLQPRYFSVVCTDTCPSKN